MTIEIDARVAVSQRAASAVKRGYLWVFANEIDMNSVPEQPGTWCRFESDRKTVGTGYVNRHSLIAGRVVSFDSECDAGSLLRSRLISSIGRRKARAMESCRLVFSESDLLPGLIVDWFPPVAVLQSNTAGIDRVLSELEHLIPSCMQETLGVTPEALVLRGDASVRHLEGIENFSKMSYGDIEVVRNGVVREEGVTISADFLAGQKTGYFLDQRDNRHYLTSFIQKEYPSSRVLDLCCYSGGWGLHALAAGADHVTFVDQSEHALHLVRASLNQNQVSEGKVNLVRGDIFSFLEQATDRYDIVIADPPAFVKSKKRLPQARKAYRKLNRLAWRVLVPSGSLFTCSCSHHLSDVDFREVIAGAVSREGGLGQVFFRGTQSKDHPVLLGMPETSYLKCLGIRKLA